MTNTDPNEWVLLNTDLTTKLAILPAAQSHLYFVMNEPGSGELKIPLESEAASLVASGMFCQASYRGAERGGFFVENISKQHANAEEGGRQWLSISGRGAMALLEDAIAWNDGTTDTTREFTNVTKASILITLLTEAQARGGLSALTWDFDAVNDSASIAWTDSETLKLTVGTSLLDVVRQFAKVGIDFEMQYSAGGFILSAYENGLGTDKAETIYFRVGTNCEEVYSDERGDVIQNALLVTYKSGSVALTDPTSIAARRRRESLLDARGAQTASSATTYGAAILDGRKDPRRGISIKLYDGVNPRAFVDYELGDYVTLDKFGVEDRYRILGIQCTFDNDQFANIVVELNSLLVENQIEMAQDLNWLLNEWNTANDANLMAVSYWAAIGAEGDTLDKANALHIIGTKLYVAAWFSNEIVGGVVCPTGIAIYDLQTGVWSTPSTAGSFLSDYPTCLTSIGTDLYVGYGSGEHVQKYDTVADTWSSLDGGLYYSVEPDQGTVNAIATDGTDIYVTGKFNEAGSPAVTVANIAKFTVATSTWSALGTGINNIGYSLLCSGSNVYAGGAFTSPSSYIAVWNGTTWAAMDSGLDGIVYSLILYGTNILAGGAFTGKISEWNGSAWTVFGGGVDNTVYALAVYLTDVYVGGAFTDAGNRISRYSGGSWWLLGNGTGTSTVFAICLYGDDVYVGGNFTEVGDAKPAIRLAVYFNNFESLTNYLENSSSNFNMGAAIHAAAASAITDTDEVPFWEATANALRKITWANIKATLKTYFDTLYVSLTQTANRILISNSSGVVTTDADLVYNSDGSITIGQIATDLTTAANGIFQGANDVSVANFLQTYGVGVASYITGLRGRGTAAAPTAVQAEDVLFRLRGRGYDSAGNAGLTSAEIRWVADQTHTTIAHGARLEFYTTPNNSTALSKVLEITSAGTLELGGSNWYSALPYGGLHVTKENGGAFVPMVTGHSYGDGTGNFTNVPTMSGDRAGGTVASPTAVLDDMGLCRFSAGGYDGTALSGTRAQMVLSAAGDWTATSHPTKISFWTTPVSSTTRAEVLTIGSDGKITIPGVADTIQLLVQGHSTQTSNLVVFENSAGTDLFSITGAGKLASTITTTVTSGTGIGAGFDHSITPASASTAEYRSLFFGNYIGANSADTTTFNSVIGGYFNNRPRTTGTIASTMGIFSQGVTLDSSSGNATVTSVYGVQIYGTGRSSGTSTLTSTTIAGAYISANTIGTGVTATNLVGIQIATPAAGTFTLNVGIQIDAQTRAATTNVGIRIYEPAGATNNYALQLIGTGGTSASGITFGTDTNLYRSAANTLKTDDSVVVMEGMVVNENGTATSDFRVESDTEANFILLDANGNTDGTLYLGGSTNGIQILKGGEMSFIGTATVWDDLRISPDVKGTGAKDPSWVAWLGSVNLYDFDNAAAGSEKELWFNVQMPHGWKEGSSVYPHVHWTNKTAGTAGHVVRWGLEYTVSKIGGTFPATATVYGTTIVGGGDITVANEHMITSFDAITMTGNTISTILSCRLFRNSSNAADTYTGTAGLLSIDWHFEVDKVGSRTEFA